jgi:Protein of unknown function (DUF726)
MCCRVIYECLLELAKANRAGLVENVFLLGAPVSVPDTDWASLRSVVADRFVNAYSSKDWVG